MENSANGNYRIIIIMCCQKDMDQDGTVARRQFLVKSRKIKLLC